jgi:hypothetical protein
MAQLNIGFSRQLNIVAGGKPAATNPVHHCGAQHLEAVVKLLAHIFQ